ncbi:DUF6988 family protein [Bathymodiolus platifrons methanotrophic gill symbiont]|uniref:DUF6988 family protein n=1 Tax=Bathymodiolus platifrons methanotrophic gill symbiont TaxID=113268 RepID=UPI001124ED3F|nr:hypothetical protein [Bathymodiolus platifrons methanotrophic gill symbiont]
MNNTTGNEILTVLEGIEFDNSDRTIMSFMSHRMVFDTQRAIFDLVQLENHAPAAALLRVLFEAHLQGLWLYSCANDNQINDFKKNKRGKLNFNEKLTQIGEVKPLLKENLCEFKKNHWNGLNNLTHSGSMQLLSYKVHSRGIKIESPIPPETLLSFSERFAISSLAAVGIDIVKCEKVSDCVERLWDAYESRNTNL